MVLCSHKSKNRPTYIKNSFSYEVSCVNMFLYHALAHKFAQQRQKLKYNNNKIGRKLKLQ